MLIIKAKTATKELSYNFNARGPVRCHSFLNGSLGFLSICHKLMFCSDLKGNQPLVHSSTSPPPPPPPLSPAWWHFVSRRLELCKTQRLCGPEVKTTSTLLKTVLIPTEWAPVVLWGVLCLRLQRQQLDLTAQTAFPAAGLCSVSVHPEVVERVTLRC